MKYIIEGRIIERESGKGVSGLIVETRDRDELHEELLGFSTSDEHGAFKVIYEGSLIKSFLLDQLELVVKVLAFPRHELGRITVHFGEKKTNPLKIEISGKNLGIHSPHVPANVVVGKVNLSKKQLHLDVISGYTTPSLPGYVASGAPGQASLLERTHFVIIPLGDDQPEIHVIPGEPMHIALTAPPARQAAAIMMHDLIPGENYLNRPPYTTFPLPQVIESATYPEKLATISEVVAKGALRLVTVIVRPLQYAPQSNEYIFYPDLRYEVRFDMEKTRLRAVTHVEKNVITSADLDQFNRLFQRRDIVFPAKDLQVIVVPTLVSTFEHLIVTVAEFKQAFENLAKWKTMRGIRSRVVTMEDIKGHVIEGQDFSQAGGALDDQEILRNFIRWAYRTWGTRYVLLGGDVGKIKIRSFVCTWKPLCLRGNSYGNENGIVEIVGPPERAFAKLSLNKDWIGWGLTSGSVAVSRNGHIPIPFTTKGVAAGQSGWYFVDSNGFSDRSNAFTPLEKPSSIENPVAVVEGPRSIVDDDFHFIWDEIPSDFYYESILNPPGAPTLPYERPGQHDFDYGNGLYGHFTTGDDNPNIPSVMIDPINLSSDVWVGRAPVKTKDEAEAFVNKVLTYERLVLPDNLKTDKPRVVNRNYLRKSVLAAMNHAFELEAREKPYDSSHAPDPMNYSHESGSTVWYVSLPLKSPFNITPVVVELENQHGMFKPKVIQTYRLFAHTLTGKNIEIPYNLSGSMEGGPCWYYGSNNEFPPMGTGSLSKTGLVVINGLKADTDVEFFVWDQIDNLTYYTSTAEEVRKIWMQKFPEFTEVERYYINTFDIQTPPLVDAINRDKLLSALNRGCHFVSLNSHGWPGGCCYLDTGAQFTNHDQLFIAYATSCSTAQPDWNEQSDGSSQDSLGEKLVLAPQSGAIAYVGSTRTTWPAESSLTQQGFWHMLGLYRRLGPAASWRRPWGTELKHLCVYFDQILYGDPEMPVWTRLPIEYQVDHPTNVKPNVTLSVKVYSKNGEMLTNQTVTLLSGWKSSDKEPKFYRRKTTNSSGQVDFDVKGLKTGDNITLTIWGFDYLPYVTSINVS